MTEIIKESQRQGILDNITPEEALEVLNALIKDDANLAKQVEQLFCENIRQIDLVDIADDLLMDLENFDVEEIWDGDEDPEDTAMMMVENAVEPYLEKILRYHSFGMLREEMLYCMGVISALYQFGNESETEFRDWAEDVSLSVAFDILSEWQGRCKDAQLNELMEFFMSELEGND